MESIVDQPRPIIERNDFEAIRQFAFAVDLVDSRLDSADNVSRIASGDHLHDAARLLRIAPFHYSAVSHLMPELHLRHIPDINRRSAKRLQHDGADVDEMADETHAANQELLGPLWEHAAARV